MLLDALLNVGAVGIVHDLRYSHTTTCYSAESDAMLPGTEEAGGETAGRFPVT